MWEEGNHLAPNPFQQNDLETRLSANDFDVSGITKIDSEILAFEGVKFLRKKVGVSQQRYFKTAKTGYFLSFSIS